MTTSASGCDLFPLIRSDRVCTEACAVRLSNGQPPALLQHAKKEVAMAWIA